MHSTVNTQVHPQCHQNTTKSMEKKTTAHHSTSSTLNPLRCIVKLGGAAITCKNEIEKINEENLQIVSSHLSQSMILSNSSRNIPGMDWSKSPGNSDVPEIHTDDFSIESSLDLSSFIIVHGAGSFGHFQASRSGVHKGGLDFPIVKAGFVATRISVTSLNLEIVRALARVGIPSVGLSPFAAGWSTCERICVISFQISSADISQVANALDSGFVPVLHGDAVLDDIQGCTILSGDVIIRHLAEILKPKYVVFLTDVFGVYDRPPTDPNAILLREIAVDKAGNWSIIKPTQEDTNKKVEFTVAEHDTTGGMVTKITEAAMIAKLGIDVYIVKAATSHSLRALKGDIGHDIPDDWLGTVIRSSR